VDPDLVSAAGLGPASNYAGVRGGVVAHSLELGQGLFALGRV